MVLRHAWALVALMGLPACALFGDDVGEPVFVDDDEDGAPWLTETPMEPESVFAAEVSTDPRVSSVTGDGAPGAAVGPADTDGSAWVGDISAPSAPVDQ